MPRTSIKIVGASGQGINSIGAIVAKGLKRSGYYVFGYREYPSLIKGGHASYQLDISDRRIRSTETRVNILVALNHHGLELNIEDLKQGGVVLHVTPDWTFPEDHQKMIAERGLRVIYFPADEIRARLGAKPVLANVLLTAALWSILGEDAQAIKSLVMKKYAGDAALAELNARCVDAGGSFIDSVPDKPSLSLPAADRDIAGHLLVTGSQAMGLGAIHAGVRLFAAYPMTPASPLLNFIADLENRTHMVVKQAEDEITAAQMVSGAMYMGTRALTATSGGGFDLMSETFSLNAMIENPTVFVLAQRPGPSTGLPTWTSQDSLLQAVTPTHGEFAHCVIAVRNSQDAFDLMPIAYNLAEHYQIGVIVLTEKHIAEALYTQPPYDLDKAKIDRGRCVTDAGALKALQASDRFDQGAEDGISLRWLPGSPAATYCAQSDEHDASGNVEESASSRKAQLEKRMRKLDALYAQLPDPKLTCNDDSDEGPARLARGDAIDMLVIGWGSSSDAIEDVMHSDALKSQTIAALHFTYIWPLRTELLQKLAKRSRRIVLVEQNYQGQLGLLIRRQCGLDITERILKYDGRPFFYDELLSLMLGPQSLAMATSPPVAPRLGM